MKLLKNNRRKNRLIKKLKNELNWCNESHFRTVTNFRTRLLDQIQKTFEARNPKQKIELLDIKDKYYKLLAAIKINEDEIKK